MNTPLIVVYDPKGRISDDGMFAPLWSSDCRPAPTLKALCAELLQAGWPLSEMLKLPGTDEPQRFSDVYKQQYEGKLPGRAFAQFQRDAKMREHMANSRDPYNTGLSDAALGGGKRSDYGQTRSVSTGGDE